MATEDEINITISGWPGGGTTSLSLLLSILLQWQYLNIGWVFRDVGKKLGYSEEGTTRPQFDEFIEPIIGATIDNYSDHKLLNESQIILESDLAAFRLRKHPKVFSIFLKTDQKERIARVTKEGRQNAVTVLIERDKILQEKYQQIWGIDIFDEQLIERRFNMVIDNTSISLETELQNVLDAIKNHPQLKGEYNWEVIRNNIDKEVADLLKEGKEHL